jgi:hypothetical protein
MFGARRGNYSGPLTTTSLTKPTKEEKAQKATTVLAKVTEIAQDRTLDSIEKQLKLQALKAHIEAVHNAVNSNRVMPTHAQFNTLNANLENICTHRGKWYFNNRTATMQTLTDEIDKQIIKCNPQNISKQSTISKAFSYCLRNDAYSAEVIQQNPNNLTPTSGKKVIYTGVAGQESILSESQFTAILTQSNTPAFRDKLILIPTGQNGFFPHAVLVAIKNGKGCIIDPNHYSCADKGIPKEFTRVKFGVQGRADGTHCARYTALIADDLAKRHLRNTTVDLNTLVTQAQQDRSHTEYTKADLQAVEGFSAGSRNERGAYDAELAINNL